MSEYTFTCPHCNQHLEASQEVLGQTVQCPSCKGQITIPKPVAQPQVVRIAAPPPMPRGPEIPQTCLLCGRGKHMNDVRTLYGHLVCKKCYYSFANRREFAYFVDILGYWAICLVAVTVFGALMGAAGSSQQEIQNMASAVAWILFPLILLFKDCFSGQSAGKAMCGVKVIDETTGEPGGLGASFQRNLPLLVPFVPLVVAFQLRKGHRTGDGWSNTKVIWKKYANHPIFAPVSATRYEDRSNNGLLSYCSPSAGSQMERPNVLSTQKGEMVEKDIRYYRRDARNIVWGIAFVAFLPTFILMMMISSGLGGRDIKWDAVTSGILTYSIVLTALAIYAGIQCGRGKKRGRTLAFIPSVLLLVNFPLGTIFGIAVLVKLNKKEFVNSLE